MNRQKTARSFECRSKLIRIAETSRENSRKQDCAILSAASILPVMKKRRQKNHSPPDGHVLLPGVSHPQGRPRAFADAMKALVRGFIEVNNNPTVAYAIDKTDRIITTENRKLMTKAHIAEWKTACNEFQRMSDEKKKAWIENVLLTYPKIDQLPDSLSYNDIN